VSWNSLGRGSRWSIVLGVGAAVGLLLAYVLSSEADSGGSAPVPVTTQTIPQGAPTLPPAVEETRSALAEAAESGDYEAIRELIPSGGFEYTFGGPVQGGPVAYWKEVERTTGDRPLRTLAAILKMPYVLAHGYYVWPFAYTAESPADLSPQELELLAPLGPPSTLFPEGIGYLGWRAGIAPDGTWTFFVAGD
jgi:hypothetical protein